MGGKFKFSIDRGGTFTDIYAKCPDGKVHVMKLLSVDPTNYSDAPREGIRRILEIETGKSMPQSEPIDSSYIEWIRMGTTVATNALLERKGERMALLITRGFKDLLHIGNQARPKIFDLEIVTPDVLYEEVLEIDCRVINLKCEKCDELTPIWSDKPIVQGVTGEDILILKQIDETALKNDLTLLRSKGINSIAVALMHSYTYNEHERTVGRIAKEVGFEHVSLSHEVMPMVKIVPRGYTACADAYLTPHIKKYVKGFASGFKNNLKDINILFMQSDGGLTPMNSFNGSRAILSGPAGGVVGYTATTPYKPVIGFDMGGTSTDVSRYDGAFEHVFESITAGVTIQAPQLDINTVAAGGGSRLFFRSGLFVVGPESAGAHPGPTCYRKGGPLTVTDANLVLGRLLPEYFPLIFGKTEDMPLDKEASLKEFEALTNEVNNFIRLQSESSNLMTLEEVAMGFIKVANESMCRPIRALTQARGYDTRQHTLACFGGAGGQHSCAIARSLGIGRVVIHKYAGILSAYGMACADVVHEVQEPCALTYDIENFEYLNERITVLSSKCIDELKKQGFSDNQLHTEPFLHLRYEGTDCALMCSASHDNSVNSSTIHGDFLSGFLTRYQKEFGFILSGRKIYADDIRVRGIGKTLLNIDNEEDETNEPLQIESVKQVYFEDLGYIDCNIYLFNKLRKGHIINGPAVLMDKLSTILVEPKCKAIISKSGDIEIEVNCDTLTKIGVELEPIQLSIFSHRFMSIAEQMGRILQRTSISTNIKERLDFSCALFGPDGGLVSNAPHIPVHLGAMQEAVQYQIKSVGNEIKEGDVILSNHPKAGGSHLPDLTVITPVFYPGQLKPVFYAASRGHHADIGGITPGSMPPHSKSLSEEGAQFKSFFLVRSGHFCEEEVTNALMAPAKEPGSSGTRNLKDNLSDLKAQIAANQKGIYLVTELINSYGLDVVQAYMDHIQKNAEIAVRDMLKNIGNANLLAYGLKTLESVDYLDDGSIIKLSVQINVQNGEAIFDFSGTSYEVWGNCNAPKAITLSALIYCLRSMIGYDIPLNQGCLKPIKVIIPSGTILDPSENAAVVGGNVLTSQRIVDVVLKAFGAAADSQGCMNNITFGQDDWGYYETVSGGAGAGPTWNGRSGVHTHMTNTRITDPEILEKRYPVFLTTFTLRNNSGGNGKYCGGDGVVRELQFRSLVTLSILTERRSFAPNGIKGGENGQKGENLLIKCDGRKIRLGAKTAVNINPGDTFLLLTPGGGGYGLLSDDNKTVTVTKPICSSTLERGSGYNYRMLQESV
ncbi:5-oxoprolinase [Acyrthosiphon pisum]|uniref:5-oxoprolinase n=1 Tax=Acyrthosiphon pisum TaxID=7029 RepID=A0A8R2FCG7_ACYPI|nr:5-oxoprolinase [Acyrthosiphon pisum]|eukprot:XP_008186368.1 PREDICTED: 5-oxoprolinase [Acyrthosiphon pisum]